MEDESPQVIRFENRGVQEERKAGTEVLFEGFTHKLIYSEFQHRGSTLKSIRQ